MPRTSLILLALAVLLIVGSNTLADGTTIGGIAFLAWVACVLAAIVIAVRERRQQSQRSGSRVSP